MVTNGQSHTVRVLLLGLLLVVCAGTFSCARALKATAAPFDLEPFKALARGAACADLKNRFFLIDNQMVFWDRRGSCADHAYDHVLFGKTPEEVLCEHHDSLAGPMTRCHNQRDLPLFETLLANVDQPNLGLGTEHRVEPVVFRADSP